MTIEALFTQINKLAETHAQAEVCRAMAHVADTDTERGSLLTRAEYWDNEVVTLHAALTAALNTAIPPTIYAHPDPQAPVRMLADQQVGVEVRGSLEQGTRAVSIRYTLGQAVTVGTAMIACAAVMQERGGGALTAIVPPIPPA